MLDGGREVGNLWAMPRAMRVEYPGAIYHVMDRGDRQEDMKGSVQQNVMFPPGAAPPMGALTTDFLFARSP